MLKYIGIKKLGRSEQYSYFECDKCGTYYPVIKGVISMNGQEVKTCPCETRKDEEQ